MNKEYRVEIRGQVPNDLSRRVSKIHAVSILRHLMKNEKSLCKGKQSTELGAPHCRCTNGKGVTDYAIGPRSSAGILR